MENWAWLRDRSGAREKRLDGYELYTLNAPRVIAHLGASTLGDLDRVSTRELDDAMDAVGCSEDEAREIVWMLGEYLAQEGLSFRREPPIAVVARPDRPSRPLLRPRLVEHVGDDYRCFLLAQPPRTEMHPSPDRWSWETSDFLLSFQVLPLDTADVEALAPRHHVGTMEAGAWGALLESERVPGYVAHAGPAYEVTLFDAQLQKRAIARVQSWSKATGRTTVPKHLMELVSLLGRSLAAR